MDILILFVLAIIPSVVCLTLLNRQDKDHPEPKSRLAAAFFAGIVSLILTLVFVNLFDLNVKEWDVGPLEKGLAGAFLEAAIPEEFFKFICLYFVIWKSKEFDEYLDGIIYAAFVGMGFATVENIFYVLDNGIGNAIFRAFTAVPGHFFDGVIMGYFFALAKFDKQHRMSNLWKSFFFAILAHGIYDGLIEVSVGFFEEDSDTLMLIGFALVIAFFIFNIKVWKYGIRKIKELAAKDKSSPNALT